MSITRPLHDLVKKNYKWDWTKKQMKAFGEAKEMFTKELVLITPNLYLKNKNKSRYVWLCNRRSVINRMQE